MPLKIIFAGTSQFAVPSLEILIHSAHHVVAVYTQPDRPAGRGRQLHVSPIKMLSEKKHIPVFQPETLRDKTTQQDVKTQSADVMVVVAYGMLLPETILNIPRLGCVNMHPSLLPKWRGAAPIQRAIAAGDRETGVSIIKMNQKMDAGPILQQEKYDLSGTETSGELHDQLSQLGARLLLTTLNQLEKNNIVPIPQDDKQATFARKIEKQEAMIDWKKSAVDIFNQIRAFNPWPIATTHLLNQSLRIFKAAVSNKKTNVQPGTFLGFENNALCIATGNGILEIQSLQLPGKKEMSASDFMHGHAQLLKPAETILR